MEARPLGRTGLQVSVLGYGCNRIADSRDTADRREVEATLHEALERGVNLIDTANCYGMGGSEELLGRVLSGRRDEVVICSKAGIKHWLSVLTGRVTDPLQQALRRPPRGGGGQAARGLGGRPFRSLRNFGPRCLERAVAGSLRRLRTDHLDLLYLHDPPPQVLRDDRVFAALEGLRERGLTRWTGVSFHGSAATEEVLGVIAARPELAVVQVRVHPDSPIDVARLAAGTQAAGVGVVARECLAKGALLTDPRFGAADGPGAHETLVRYAAHAAGVDALLIGMRSRSHLRTNLAAVAAGALTSRELARLGGHAARA